MERATFRHVVRLLRVHQWLKNMLVFLPIIGAQAFDVGTLFLGSVAWLAFSLTASATYVLNDVHDREADKLHPEKAERPFASGLLSPSIAPLLIVPLLATAIGMSVVLLPIEFSGVLAGYFVLTTAYSFRLKETVLVDVLALAGLYTLRVIGGSAATGIVPSVWLLGFCLFFFFSLALLKRYAELHRSLIAGNSDETLPGRAYRPVDHQVLVVMGVATGCISALVLALYVISDQFAEHYSRPYLLWQLCPLTLYWIGRAWIVVPRREMLADPLVWAVRDSLSRLVAIAAVLLLLAAR